MTQHQREQLIQSVTLDDIKSIQPDHALIIVAEQCGMETVHKLIASCGGINIYVPRAESIQPLVKRYVKQQFNGTNAKHLALHLGISERLVRKLLKEESNEKQTL